MKTSMNNLLSPVTRAIADLPATLAAEPRPGDEAAAISAGAELPVEHSNPMSARWDAAIGQLDRRDETAANDAVAAEDVGGATDFRGERALARSVLAKRLFLARELCGLSQTEASVALGFAKSGQLSLVESAKKVPPLDLILRASQLYGVSCDFLFGLSEEVDRDVRLARRSATRSYIASAINGLADVLAEVGERLIEAPAVEAQPLAAAASRVVDAFARVACRPEFAEIRGGATLAREVRQLEATLEPVLRDLRRLAAVDADLRARMAAAKAGCTSG